MSNGVQSFLAAIVIALFGLIPLGLMAMGSSEISAPDPGVPTTPGSGSGAILEPRSIDADEVGRTVVTTPAPEIAGVTDEVARVLAAGGFATVESIEGVPESVVRVLSAHGAVLTVAVGEGG
jgi:hypothetical protein